jgi:glucose/arabinose dehydrogenase
VWQNDDRLYPSTLSYESLATYKFIEVKIMSIRWLQLVLLAVYTQTIVTAFAAPAPLEYQKQRLQLGHTAYDVTVPRGYRLELLTDELEKPRMLTFNDNGELFVGSRTGRVYRLRPPYTRTESMLVTGDYPHSVAFRAGEILIAMTNGLFRAPYRAGQNRINERSLKLLAPLPGGSGHSSRTVVIGPDGRVYVSLGISSNCSDQYLGAGYSFDKQRGGVIVLHEEGANAHWQPYASGLRNPVGIAWNPVSQTLYATNNGPDHWGYDLPPEYFSRVTPGSFHGMPWYQYDGYKIREDKCIKSTPPLPITDVTIPVATFPARNAPLGVTFVPHGALDSRLAGDAIVALHGSWGTQPFGSFSGDPASRREPKLVVVRFDNGKAQSVDDLVTGFQLLDGSRWARPAGVAFGPDGALYFSSDSDTEGLFRLRRTD